MEGKDRQPTARAAAPLGWRPSPIATLSLLVVQGGSSQDSDTTSAWVTPAPGSPADVNDHAAAEGSGRAAAKEPAFTAETSPSMVDPARARQRRAAESPSSLTQAPAESTPALAAPVDPEQRRAKAVAAFFVELCGRACARQLTEETLADYARRSLAGEIDSSVGSLLSVARSVAARRHVVASPRAGWRVAVTRALAEERDCSSTPSLLAARADGELIRSDQGALESHLDACPTCRAATVRWDRAERAFAAVMQFDAAAEMAPINDEVTELLPAPAAADAAFTAPAGTAAGAPAAAAAATTAAADPAAAGHATATMPSADRRARRRRAALVGAAIVALIVCAGAGAALLAGGSSHHVNANATVPAAPSADTPKVAAPIHHRAQHPNRAVHRRRHHAKPKPAPVASAPTSSATVPSSNPAAAPATSSPSASAPQPVAASPPPPSSSSGGGGGGGGGRGGGGSSGGSGGSSSATLQQPSLGASNAPTQGINP